MLAMDVAILGSEQVGAHSQTVLRPRTSISAGKANKIRYATDTN